MPRSILDGKRTGYSVNEIAQLGHCPERKGTYECCAV